MNDWFDDRASRSAAALAYYSVFSLAPLLLIAIGLAGLIFGHDVARGQILEQVTTLLGAQGALAVESMMGSRESAPRAGLLSAVVGVATLLIGAVGVLVQLKDALNTVWDVELPTDESWMAFGRRYLVNFALVIATGFLLLVSLVATAFLNAVSQAAQSWLPGPVSLWFVLDVAMGLLMTAAMFALIFKVLPDADVRWRDVGVGALVTAVLFSLGRLALGAYLTSGGSDSAYGAASSVLALLVWVYYSSQLVLLGAEFTHAYARFRAGGAASGASQRESAHGS